MTDLPRRPRLLATGDACLIEDEQGNRAEFPRYQHSPLPSQRTIRLLKGEPQTRSWPLSSLSRMNEFTLVEYELDNTDVSRLDVSNSPYVAMSYAWGDPVFDAPLVINYQGERAILPVTATAWEAVQRTLPALDPHGKLMWIDQICIDQGDAIEKSKQVMLMGDIYRRCWHCMIWLGPSDPSSEAAFSLLHSLGMTFAHNQSIPTNEREMASMSHAQIRASLTKKLGKDMLPVQSHPGWAGLANLLQRPWFTRLWTFQEAVLCYKGDATVRCGAFHIPVITFMRASMFLGNDHAFAGINFSNSRSALAQVSSFRYHVEHNNVTPLIWLLSTNGIRGCSNPSDRVYAFLGVRKEDGPSYPIEVDYQQSPKDLYTNLARKIIQSQSSLRICAEAPERIQDDGISDLPSWVPDWTRKPLAIPFERLNPAQSYFKASNRRAHFDHVQDPKVLLVKGKIIDQIVGLVPAEVPDTSIVDERRRALVDQVLPELQMTLRSKMPGTDDAKVAHTIINTITVGGFTRENYQGDFGLQPDAWSESTCGHMLNYFLHPSRYSMVSPIPVDPDQWLYALAQQAIQCINRRFAVLEDYKIGLVPKLTKIDDLVVILHGCSLPVILRSAGDGGFVMIGTCFVDGIMHGERVDWDSGHPFRIY